MNPFDKANHWAEVRRNWLALARNASGMSRAYALAKADEAERYVSFWIQQAQQTLMPGGLP